MSATSVQIPPDSTGKRIATTERRHVGYDNKIADIQVGDIISGQTSGASGKITSFGTEGYPVNSGVLHLKDFTGSFQDNEVLEISATPVANIALDVETEIDLHLQQVIVSDPDDPHNRQKVDRFGATVNTFTDGSPVFTPFGAMSVGQAQIIKDYRFAYNSEDDKFWDHIVGTGSISYEANKGTVLLSTGGPSGDKAFRTSHFYHPYIPGIGSSVEMSMEVGDTGKANLRRCWGLFDDENGVFFEHDITGLNIVVRSNTTGSVVNTKTSQADFNKDKVNGSDSIGLSLDVAKGNIYFIDFQWLGAGRVNFGMLAPTGERIIMHVVENANTNNMPYMATATLPIRIEQENTGVVASSSELRFLCGTVKHTSMTNPDSEKHTEESGIVSTIAEKAFLSFRPTATINTKTNRVTAEVETMYFINTSAEPALVTLYYGTSLTAASWALSGSSALDVDTSATSFSGGAAIKKVVISPNSVVTVIASEDTGLHGLSLHLEGDGTTQPIYSITVKSLTASNTSVAVVVNWGELRF